MKLDRNLNSTGVGKYALVSLRKLAASDSVEVRTAFELLLASGIIELGCVGDEDEFFVMKLKDVNTPGGLIGYASVADKTDPEWANEVRDMATRAGANSMFCKIPD